MGIFRGFIFLVVESKKKLGKLVTSFHNGAMRSDTKDSSGVITFKKLLMRGAPLVGFWLLSWAYVGKLVGSLPYLLSMTGLMTIFSILPNERSFLSLIKKPLFWIGFSLACLGCAVSGMLAV